MKPDYICIGAQKAGTTWLHWQFSHHPEFSVLPIKELHYFDRDPHYSSLNTLSETRLVTRLKKKEWRKRCIQDIAGSLRARDLRRARWWARYHLANYSDRWYSSLFDLEPGLTGDMTPSYSMLDEKDVARLHETAPGAKIIFMLRNPIDRAWSMLRYEQRLGIALDNSDFEGFRQRVDSPHQELRSDYLRTIELYKKYFDAKNILIGFYSAVSQDPRGLLRAIYEHLGVADTGFHHAVGEKVNHSKPQDCPGRFRNYLVQKYKKDIERISKRYGSYTDLWLRSLDGTGAARANTTAPLPPVIHP